MPLLRFRLRSLMIAVAVAVVLLAVGMQGRQLWQRSGLYRQQAAYHRAQLGIIVDPPYLNPQQYREVQGRIARRRDNDNSPCVRLRSGDRYNYRLDGCR